MLKIVDGGILSAILLQEVTQQPVEFLLADSLAKHAKDHCAFVKDNRLVRSRLIVKRARRSRNRCSLFKRKRPLLLLALGCLERASRQIRFPKCEGAPLRQSLRNPRIIKRLQPHRLAPPLISHFTLELFFGNRARRVEQSRSQEDH